MPSRLQLVLDKALHEVHAIQKLIYLDQQRHTSADVGYTMVACGSRFARSHASSQTDAAAPSSPSSLTLGEAVLSVSSTSHAQQQQQQRQQHLHWTAIGMQRDLHAAGAAAPGAPAEVGPDRTLSGLRRLNLPRSHRGSSARGSVTPRGAAHADGADDASDVNPLDTGRLSTLSTFSNIDNDLFAADDTGPPLMQVGFGGFDGAPDEWGTPATEWGSYKGAPGSTTPVSAAAHANVPMAFYLRQGGGGGSDAATPVSGLPVRSVGQGVGASGRGSRLPTAHAHTRDDAEPLRMPLRSFSDALAESAGTSALGDLPDPTPPCAPVPAPCQSPRLSGVKLAKAPLPLPPASAARSSTGALPKGRQEQQQPAVTSGSGRAVPFAAWRSSFDSASAVVKRLATGGGGGGGGGGGSGIGRRSLSSVHPSKENDPSLALVASGAAGACGSQNAGGQPLLSRRSMPNPHLAPCSAQQQPSSASGSGGSATAGKAPASGATQHGKPLTALASEKGSGKRQALTALAASLRLPGLGGKMSKGSSCSKGLSAAKQGLGLENQVEELPRMAVKSLVRAQAEAVSAFGGASGEVMGAGVSPLGPVAY